MKTGFIGSLIREIHTSCGELTGPSLNYDGSWTSTAQCLEQAGALVTQGLVEAAIVTACSLIGHVSLDKEFKDLQFLSTDGVTSPFDAQGKV